MLVGMESEPKTKRRRYSASERAQLVAAWHGSGESAAMFGRRHEVHASNLIRWARGSEVGAPSRAKKRTAKASFVELRSAVQRADVRRDEDRAHLELECPNGLKLRACGHIDVELLARLATTLGGVRPC